MGYAAAGLELWAYPVQIASGYELGFRAAGTATEINGSSVLRRITYEPDAVIRTYIGPDFVIRERLFVPLNGRPFYSPMRWNAVTASTSLSISRRC